MSLVSLLCAKLSSSYTDISPVGLEPTLMDSWTHLEPDILECEVKWALRSITSNKASGGDIIPAELFQILKDDAVKSTAPNMPANLENSAMAMRLENVSFHSNRKHNAKECSNYCTIALISHASQVMLKILQARFRKYTNQELSDGQAAF